MTVVISHSVDAAPTLLFHIFMMCLDLSAGSVWLEGCPLPPPHSGLCTAAVGVGSGNVPLSVLAEVVVAVGSGQDGRVVGPQPRGCGAPRLVPDTSSLGLTEDLLSPPSFSIV